MSDKKFTVGQKKWLELREAARASKPNAWAYFKNIALTVDGMLCVGMSYSAEWRRYSCTYLLGEDGKINTEGDSRRWDCEGGSLDGGSDLNLETVSDAIYKC